jgi:hypothetical protein
VLGNAPEFCPAAVVFFYEYFLNITNILLKNLPLDKIIVHFQALPVFFSVFQMTAFQNVSASERFLRFLIEHDDVALD